MFNRHRLAETVAARFAIPDLIFIIVVPGGIDAHLQQLRGDAVLPPGDGRRVSEIEMRAFVIPEAGALRRVGFGIANKQPLLRDLLIARVILQQAGLDIGGKFQPGVMERHAHRFRLRHFVVVPVKDVALVIDGGVPRRELEGVARDRVFFTQANKVHQLVLRIRRVGVMHR